MIGELESKQVLALSAQGGSAEEIAEALDMELAAVKLVLNRHEAGTSSDRDITDDQLASLRQHAYHLALGAEDQSIQARMTMFLIERDKPSKREVSGGIAAINNAIILAGGEFNKLKEEYSS